jgi:cytoskeletal protein RodZ
MEITTAALSNADTTLDKIVNNNSTRQITLHTSKKTSTKVKPPKNNSALWKRPPAKKSSSSPSILSVLLLLFFILGIIGSILFVLFRFRRNQQDDNESLLDRVGSEESHKSDIDDSELDPSTEYEMSTDAKSEVPERGKNRKGGRMVSQLDPDAL